MKQLHLLTPIFGAIQDGHLYICMYYMDLKDHNNFCYKKQQRKKLTLFFVHKNTTLQYLVLIDVAAS
jgi:hypothetical protein